MIKYKFLIVILAVIFFDCASAQKFRYDFSTGYEGWAGDFADYPVNDSIFYQLEFKRASLPAPLDINKFSLFISGNNHSDDLFMFIKKKIIGLLPNTTYRVLIDVDFASKAPTNAFGVGGPPGEGVTVKAGATLVEPIKVVGYSDWYRMNINKENQINPGADMDTIGNVGVTDTTTVFAIVNRNNASHLFSITTDAKGEVWICIGTDSGFEATTTLYYSIINIEFFTTTPIDDDMPAFINYSLEQNYPNPFNPGTKIRYSILTSPQSPPSQGGEVVTLKVYDILGNEVATLVNKQQEPGYYEIDFNSSSLASGIYIYRLQYDKNVLSKKMIVMK